MQSTKTVILALVMAFVLLFSVACSNRDEQNSEAPSSTASSSKSEPTTPPSSSPPSSSSSAKPSNSSSSSSEVSSSVASSNPPSVEGPSMGSDGNPTFGMPPEESETGSNGNPAFGMPPVTDNPQGMPTDENNIKPLSEPMFDPFPLQYPFLTAHIYDQSAEPLSIIKIDMIYGTAQESVTLTSEEQIQALWNLMGETEVTMEGALDANPSTGGGLTLQFQFSDKSTATVTMAMIVQLNYTGTFLFVDDTSEQRFVDFFYSMQ